MKKYIAILLIAVMAVSVVSAAGVVTAPKAAAKLTPDRYVFAVDYTRAPVGTTYKWTVMNYDYHRADPAKPGCQAAAYSTRNLVMATASIVPSGPFRCSAGGQVGVQLKADPGSAAWETLKDRKVMVKVTVRSLLAVNGAGHAFANADLQTNGAQGGYGLDSYATVQGRDAYVKKETLTFGGSGWPYDYLTLQYMNDNVIVGLSATVFSGTVKEQATAIVSIESVQVTFLS